MNWSTCKDKQAEIPPQPYIDMSVRGKYYWELLLPNVILQAGSEAISGMGNAGPWRLLSYFTAILHVSVKWMGD